MNDSHNLSLSCTPYSVAFFCHDLEESVRFYKYIFDLEELDIDEDDKLVYLASNQDALPMFMFRQIEEEDVEGQKAYPRYAAGRYVAAVHCKVTTLRELMLLRDRFSDIGALFDARYKQGRVEVCAHDTEGIGIIVAWIPEDPIDGHETGAVDWDELLEAYGEDTVGL